MTLSTELMYVASGFLVGAIVGLTGVGGGSLMTPLLVLLFGVHPATAVGTDLLQACVTKTVGTIVHRRDKGVDWLIVGRLALGSVPGAMLGLLMLSRLDTGSPLTAHVISLALGTTLLITAAGLLLRDRLLRWAAVRTTRPTSSRTTALTVMLGALVGILVSLTSIGAGAIGVTALLVLYPQIPIRRLIGSDIAHAIPLTFVAGIGHWLLGSVDWGLVSWLLIGSIPGITLSSLFIRFVPNLVLVPALAAILALVGFRLVR